MCGKCGSVFKQSSHLKVHMNSHAAEKKYPCDLCDKRFKYKASLAEHKVVHYEEAPKYCCDECNKVF